MTLWKRFLSIALCLCLCLLCTAVPIPAEAAAVTDLPISITGSPRSYQYAKSGTNLTELQYGTTTANKTAGSITTTKTSGGGTKFTIDTGQNKYFKLVYQEIPVTITVPAKTDYSVEFTYDFDGQHTRSNTRATANVSMAFIYQGENRATDKIKFYPTNGGQVKTTIDGVEAENVYSTGITYNGGSTASKTIDMASASGKTYTADFSNKTSAEKDITRYFGYWVSCDYGSSYSNKAVTNFTLTPKSVSYTIYLNYGNGSVNNTKKTVKYGEPYGELPSPTLDDSNFGGWYSESYGYGDEVFSTTEVTNPASHTLYVYWVPKPSPSWGTSEEIELGEQTRAGFYGLQTNKEENNYLVKWYKCNKDKTGAVQVGYWFFGDDVTVESEGELYVTPRDLPLGKHYYYSTTTHISKRTGKSATAESPVCEVTVGPATPSVYNKDFPTANIDLKVSRYPRDFDIVGGTMMNPHSGVIVPGTFSWESGDTEITSTGQQKLYVIFTPDDQTSYKTTRIGISANVTCSHDYVDYKVITAATCTENGKMRQKCSVCGGLTTRVIPATGHDYQNGPWQTNETQHRKKCLNCDSTDTPADHTFGEWSGGKRACEVCGYEQTQVVSVTITWNEMSFTYTDGEWDPDTHDYSAGKWSENIATGNEITVENEGEGEVNISFTYTKTDQTSAVNGSFTDRNENAQNSSSALPPGGKKYTLLHLSGKPKRNMDNETIGTVTVYIGGSTQ